MVWRVFHFQPGVCDKAAAEVSDDDYEYDDMPDAVEDDRWWGYCQPRCQGGEVAEELRETDVTVYSEEGCWNGTKGRREWYQRARVDRY